MRQGMLGGLLVAGTASLTLVACGGDDGDNKEPSDRQAVKQVVEALQSATRAKDAATICSDLYTRDTVQSLEKLPGGCEGRVKRAFVKDAGGVKAETGAVTVKGKNATARVRSRSPSGKRASELYRFRNEGGRWRIVVAE